MNSEYQTPHPDPLASCSMLHSLYFDMQHDNFQERMFWPFDYTLGAECVCKARISACNPSLDLPWKTLEIRS